MDVGLWPGGKLAEDTFLDRQADSRKNPDSWFYRWLLVSPDYLVWHMNHPEVHSAGGLLPQHRGGVFHFDALVATVRDLLLTGVKEKHQRLVESEVTVLEQLLTGDAFMEIRAPTVQIRKILYKRILFLEKLKRATRDDHWHKRVQEKFPYLKEVSLDRVDARIWNHLLSTDPDITNQSLNFGDSDFADTNHLFRALDLLRVRWLLEQDALRRGLPFDALTSKLDLERRDKKSSTLVYPPIFPSLLEGQGGPKAHLAFHPWLRRRLARVATDVYPERATAFLEGNAVEVASALIGHVPDPDRDAIPYWIFPPGEHIDKLGLHAAWWRDEAMITAAYQAGLQRLIETAQARAWGALLDETREAIYDEYLRTGDLEAAARANWRIALLEGATIFSEESERASLERYRRIMNEPDVPGSVPTLPLARVEHPGKHNFLEVTLQEQGGLYGVHGERAREFANLIDTVRASNVSVTLTNRYGRSLTNPTAEEMTSLVVTQGEKLRITITGRNVDDVQYWLGRVRDYFREDGRDF